MPTASSPRQDRALRRSAVAMVVLAAVLAFGCVLSADTTSATLLGIDGPACALRSVAGENACPGCGLTRSTAMVLDGDLTGAVAVHAGGLFVVLACIGGLLVHGHALLRRRRTLRHDRLLRAGRILFAGGVLAAWGLRWATGA